MSAGQVEAEGLCSLHELAQVCVPAEQIVNELSAKGLFFADELAPGFSMTVGKRRHRVVDDLQDRCGCGPHRPAVALTNDRR